MRFKTLENGKKNEAEMPKQVPPNAVLVKKHNKMIGKKWILNMDFLRISSNPQPIGFRGNLLVKRQKFFYCTYSLGITETS